jgi:hypothetical protein
VCAAEFYSRFRYPAALPLPDSYEMMVGHFDFSGKWLIHKANVLALVS